METDILDALYEAGSRRKAYLGTVQMTDYTHMIDTRIVTLWQPAPSTLAEAKAWAEAQKAPANHLVDHRAVVSFVADMEWSKAGRS